MKKGKYNEQTLVDAGCSPGAIRFISNMLQLDPTKRLTAKEAMKDPWILEYIDQAKNETQDVMHAIKNLKKFSLTKKLQEATIQYIVQHLATPDELADL